MFSEAANKFPIIIDYSSRFGHFKYVWEIDFFFYTGYVYSGFMFFFTLNWTLLGGEGGCLDLFFSRLLARDPPSVVGCIQR